MTEHSSVEGYFIVRQVPEGNPPEEIRRALVGLALPLHYARDVESPDPAVVLDWRESPVYLDDSVHVFTTAVIRVLEHANQHEAATWFHRNSEARKTLGVNSLYAVFNARDGLIVSPESKEKFFPD